MFDTGETGGLRGVTEMTSELQKIQSLVLIGDKRSPETPDLSTAHFRLNRQAGEVEWKGMEFIVVPGGS